MEVTGLQITGLEVPGLVPGSLDLGIDLIERHLRPAAILLFGSGAAGRLRAASDVDLALLAGGPPPDAFSVASLRVQLAALLQRDVDVVILDNASPVLAMEVLRNHRVLRNPQPEVLERFVVRTLSAYFDLKQVRRPIEAALLQPVVRR